LEVCSIVVKLDPIINGARKAKEIILGCRRLKQEEEDDELDHSYNIENVS